MSEEIVKTVVVNIIGGPGSGKSVLMALIFAHLKSMGYTAELVTEYAKTLIYAKNFKRLNNQHFVSNKQYDMFKAVCGSVQYLITDTCLISGLYYNQCNKFNNSDVAKTEQFILESFGEFENFNIYLERGEFKYETQGRQQNEEEAKQIDTLLIDILQKHKVKYHPVKLEGLDVKPVLDLILKETKHLVLSSQKRETTGKNL
jgi:ABC-type dipeptide/oligopeptide/nickel transport system ATPase component